MIEATTKSEAETLAALEARRWRLYCDRDGLLATCIRRVRWVLGLGLCGALTTVWMCLGDTVARGGSSETPFFDWWHEAKDLQEIFQQNTSRQQGRPPPFWGSPPSNVDSLTREAMRALPRKGTSLRVSRPRKETPGNPQTPYNPQGSDSPEDSGNPTSLASEGVACPEMPALQCKERQEDVSEPGILGRPIRSLLSIATAQGECQAAESLAETWARNRGRASEYLMFRVANCWIRAGSDVNVDRFTPMAICQASPSVALAIYKNWILYLTDRGVDDDGLVIEEGQIAKAKALSRCAESYYRDALDDMHSDSQFDIGSMLSALGGIAFETQSDIRDGARYYREGIGLLSQYSQVDLREHWQGLMEICSLIPCSGEEFTRTREWLAANDRREDTTGVSLAMHAIWSLRSNEYGVAAASLIALQAHVKFRSAYDPGFVWKSAKRFLRTEHTDYSENNIQALKIISVVDGPYTPEREAALNEVLEWTLARVQEGGAR